MGAIELTPQMIVVLGFLALTIYMFVSEIVRVDVTAITIMILLGITNLFKPGIVDGISTPWLQTHFPTAAEALPWLNQALAPVISAKDLFVGFSGNAVMSIIAVMIIGAGLDRTGLMGTVANFILQIGGTTEKRIIPLISGTVGTISSFMQNVGAAALFLPVVSRISNRTGLPLSRLLMPMGFCAILGGTITMVGSSPLILLNDLILNSNKALPPGREAMATFDLFDVTPIGLALVASGILYFILAGRYVLPAYEEKKGEKTSTMDYFRKVYGLEGELYELVVTHNSPLVGLTIEQVSHLDNSISIIAVYYGDRVVLAPPRDEMIYVGSRLALMGEHDFVTEFAERNQLEVKSEMEIMARMLSPSISGISEVVIPPDSLLIGKTLKEIRMSKTYGTNLLAVHRGGQTIRENRSDLVLQSGDVLILHSRWKDLHALAQNRDFVVVTDYPRDESRPNKVPHALVFFAIALSLVLFTDLRLSISLMVGAVGMILSRVLTIDEAYKSVDWKTVFLLASLIPLGMAVETTQTAAWIANQTLLLLSDVPVWVLQAAIAVLGTAFTLVMSNVGATVLLVPLAVNIALGAGADPRIFALTVAISTSNSFLIPTHQVNALIMGPAGYRVADFMKAGGIMTLVFLVVSLAMLNLIF
jgi:di/tricarboxylate transporter